MSRYFLTTTLPYVNDRPHLGFALEVVQADALARYHRALGDEVFFNFGTDEHGAKIYKKALEEKKDPQAYVDEYAGSFQELKKSLNLSYDAFIRTTDARHVKAAQEFWKLCEKAGDIYKKEYKTKYCIGCELEKTDSELKEGKCPLHPNLEIEIREEENYFFRLSRYGEKLLELYKREDFLIPRFRLNEMISLIEKEGLQDFSISRLASKMPWGVPVPDDSEHVMYVWFDALINYISTLGWPENTAHFNDFWPGTQLAGKDQVRQQAAMWQAMLMSAGLPNTKQIFIHGFISLNGQKISKSLGNVVYPDDLVKKYGTDAVRYYLLRHVHPFEDSDFSEEKFREAYNANLANGLGNLVARVMKLSEDNGIQRPRPAQFTFEPHMQTAINTFEFNDAMGFIWQRIQIADQRITKEEPYKVIKENPTAGKAMVQFLVQDLFEIGNMLAPFMPATSEKILAAVSANKKPDNLFQRLES